MSSKHPTAGSGKEASTAVRVSEQLVAEPATDVVPCAPSTVADPSPRAQVIVDNTNKLNRPVTGTVAKQSVAEVNVDDKPANVVSEVRRNPPRNARSIRVSDCQLCDELNNMDMVQCDSCNRWFHFACVQVTQEIQDVSWCCAKCATVSHKQPTAPPVVDRNQTPTNPPPSQRSWSIGRSSQSESRRRLKLQLLKIEEEKKLEQKYLEKRFEALLEFGSDTSTVISDTEANRADKI